jgi:hypothetical protein
MEDVEYYDRANHMRTHRCEYSQNNDENSKW